MINSSIGLVVVIVFMSYLSPHYREDTTPLRDAWEEFGEPTMVCRPSRTKSIASSLGASTLCLIGVAIFIEAIRHREGVWVTAVIGSALALTGSGFAISHLRKLSFRVFVCRDGLVVAQGRTVETCRWGEIEALWESVTKLYYPLGAIPIYLGIAYEFRVRRADGAKFVFAGNTSTAQFMMSGNLYGVAELGAAIREATHHRLLSQAEASVRVCGAVAFGPLQISEAGLSTCAGTLLWSEVEGVAVNDHGIVVVRRVRRRRRWYTVEAAAVPNLAVFLALADLIQRGIEEL